MTDDQQQPNEFPAPKPLPGSVYIRPGIDDRPDYDKVLSPEDMLYFFHRFKKVIHAVNFAVTRLSGSN